MVGRASSDRISVIVSAVAGVSNALQAAIDSAVAGNATTAAIDGIRRTHREICEELRSTLDGFDSERVMNEIEPNFKELGRLLDVIIIILVKILGV